MATYHHGDLASALRTATAELVAERGTSGFSLREVARRAGVSHAAPAHHFGDAEGMLTSVAAEGFRILAEHMEAAARDGDDALSRLRRTGLAYVQVATNHPGHFAVMMQNDLLCEDDEHLLTNSVRAYEALQNVIMLIRDEHNPDLDVDAAATYCWASIQGLVTLSPKLEDVANDTGTTTAPLETLVEVFSGFLINGLKG